MSSEPWSALVVGCGKIAGGYNAGPDDTMVLTHALAYARHPRFELVACVEPDETARERFMRKWSVRRGYGTLDEALDCQRFDIVSVCSPTGTHVAHLARLLAADIKAVFAEKPLDGAAQRARELAQKFRAKNVPVAVNFTRRFDPTMHELRDAIQSGRYGALRSVTGWCSGSLLNNGSHLIDLVIFLTGRAPAISARTGGMNLRSAQRAETFSFDLGEASFTVIGSEGTDVTRFEIELACADAVITIEDAGLAIRTRRRSASDIFPGEVVLNHGQWSSTHYGSALLRALDELANWHEGARLSSDIASACEAIELVDALNSRTVAA